MPRYNRIVSVYRPSIVTDENGRVHESIATGSGQPVGLLSLGGQAFGEDGRTPTTVVAVLICRIVQNAEDMPLREYGRPHIGTARMYCVYPDGAIIKVNDRVVDANYTPSRDYRVVGVADPGEMGIRLEVDLDEIDRTGKRTLP